MIADFFFVLFAVMAIGGATAMVFARNPLASLLYLVMAFFALSGIFVLLDAHFIAAVNLIVYAGAILVLFLFVIMLLNLRTVEPFGSGRPLQALLGVLVAAMIGGLVLSLAALLHPELGGVLPGAEETGTALTIGRALVGSHLFVFEFISLLLVAAIVGAVYLTKKELR